MRKNTPSEQRAKVDSGFAARRDVPFRLPRAVAWLVVLIGAGVTGFIDALTPPEIWLGPVYMIFIGLAAWTLGWREGVGIMAASMAAALYANGGALYPSPNHATWQEIVVRVVPLVALIGLLGYSRHFAEREWRLARTDTLTGALNRKAFFELTGSIERSKGWHLLAYADLDGLKAVNDRRRHATGDICLKTYATAVRKAIRRDDLFARVGGDEFLVFLAVKDEAAARDVAERLHAGMNAVPGEADNVLRCSVGALLIAPGAVSLDKLVRQADDLMYRAKQRGAALEIALAGPSAEPAAAGRARGALRAPKAPAGHGRKPLHERRELAGAPFDGLDARH